TVHVEEIGAFQLPVPARLTSFHCVDAHRRRDVGLAHVRRIVTDRCLHGSEAAMHVGDAKMADREIDFTVYRVGFPGGDLRLDQWSTAKNGAHNNKSKFHHRFPRGGKHGAAVSAWKSEACCCLAIRNADGNTERPCEAFEHSSMLKMPGLKIRRLNMRGKRNRSTSIIFLKPENIKRQRTQCAFQVNRRMA